MSSLPGTGKTRKSALKSKASTRNESPGQQETIPEVSVKQLNTAAPPISAGGA